MLRDENGKFIKGNEGFWKGKKRPNLVLPQFFAKGQKSWNKGTKGLMPEPWNKGQNLSDDIKAKISQSRKGIRASIASEFKKGEFKDERHPLWKGDNAGYVAKHYWIARKLGRPKFCSNCTKKDRTARSYHWHNISGEYKRELDDWIRLCSSCHRKEHGNNK